MNLSMDTSEEPVSVLSGASPKTSPDGSPNGLLAGRAESLGSYRFRVVAKVDK